MLHYLWMLIVGIVVGLIARALLPGADKMGLMITGILGIVGSYVGGMIGQMFSKPAEGSKFHAAGFIMSVIGAMILLFAWRFIGPMIK